MTQPLKTLIGIAILTAYLVGGGFMLIGSMSHHHETGGCPFMPSEQAICQMDATEHISAWQSMFAAIAPTLFVLVLLAIAFVVVARHWYPPPDTTLSQSVSERRNEIEVIPLFQQLFSDGILHPKIP